MPPVASPVASPGHRPRGPTSRRHWGFFDVPDLHAEAEQARTQVAGFLEALDGMARRYDERRAQALARA